MNKVVVKSKYNKDLYRKYYLFHMFKKSTSIYFVFLLGILVLFMAIRNTFQAGLDSANLIIVWVLASFTLLLTPMLMWGRIRGIMRQEIASRKDSIEVIEVSKDKITRKIEGISEKLVFGWNNIIAAHETKDFFLLYVNKDSALVIVKNDFSLEDNNTKDDAVNALRKLINNNMMKNRKGKIAFKQHFKEVEND